MKTGAQQHPALYMPVSPEHKGRAVQAMFASIAPRYDLLNDLLSFRQHRAWRVQAVKLAAVRPGSMCLDVCTGTGMFASVLSRAAGADGRVLGLDFCASMIRQGLPRTFRNAAGPLAMMVADAESIPCAASLFDVVTVGFGVRNVVHLQQAVNEMSRVAKPGGKVVILEFTRPENRPLVNWYLFRALPRIGGLLSKKDAYAYLPESMRLFVTSSELTKVMQSAGLKNVVVHRRNFGTVCIHIGEKPEPGEIMQ